MNKQFFFGQYRRVNSYFEGTELACSGLPLSEELTISEPLRDGAARGFHDPIQPCRRHIRRTCELISARGCEL